MTDLTQVPQNQTDTGRIGDAIRTTSLDIKYGIEGNTAGAACQAVRTIVFAWVPNTNPAIGDILILTAGLETLSIYNTDNAKLFKILFDKTSVVMNDVASARKCTGQIQQKVRIPEKYRDTKFVAGGVVGSNKIWQLDVSAVGANAPTQDVITRLNYSDS